MSAVPKTSNDYHVADMKLADWGRKEIAIAETEMPGGALGVPHAQLHHLAARAEPGGKGRVAAGGPVHQPLRALERGRNLQGIHGDEGRGACGDGIASCR